MSHHWYIYERDQIDDYVINIRNGDEIVAGAFTMDAATPTEEEIERANLIKAAPEMKEALEYCLEYLSANLEDDEHSEEYIKPRLIKGREALAWAKDQRYAEEVYSMDFDTGNGGAS